MIRVARVALVFQTFVLLVGCDGGSRYPVPNVDRVPVAPVSGTVHYRGKPAEGVRVKLNPLGRADGGAFFCETITDEQGNFVCGVYASDDGLPPGRYEVRAIWPEQLLPDPSDELDRLGGRFNRVDKPFMLIEIKEGKNDLPIIELK